MSTSPIIIIGMHRSGTTMLSRQLEALGVFMGNKKESNHEATFFLGIDSWLVTQCGGAWDNPQAIRYLLENKQVRARNLRLYTALSARDAPHHPVPWMAPVYPLSIPIRTGHTVGMEKSTEHLHPADMAGPHARRQDHSHLSPRRGRCE